MGCKSLSSEEHTSTPRSISQSLTAAAVRICTKHIHIKTHSDVSGDRWTHLLTPIQNHMSIATCIIYCWSQTWSSMSNWLDMCFNLNHLDLLLPAIRNAPGWFNTKHKVIPGYWVQAVFISLAEDEGRHAVVWNSISFESVSPRRRFSLGCIMALWPNRFQMYFSTRLHDSNYYMSL